MKLLYATSIDLPSTRANRLQVTSMAEAFHRALGESFLLGLRAKGPGYPLALPHREMGAVQRSWTLAWAYLRIAKRGGFTCIYCREEKLLFFMLFFNRFFFRTPLRFYYEMHHLQYRHSWWFRYVLRHVGGIVSITAGMKEEVARVIPPARILVAPDGVDIALFDIALGKDDARRSLKLPMDKRIILYTGTINEAWKGVGVLWEAAQHFDSEYLFILVGGKPHYVEEFNRVHPPLPNMLLLGHRPHAEIPLYLKAADIGVLPNSAQAEISRLSTSPMKLFEYMAAGCPIVASNLPSIREILNPENAVLVPPDDAAALAAGIRVLAENPHRSAALALQARREVEHYTWDKRAERILKFIA